MIQTVSKNTESTGVEKYDYTTIEHDKHPEMNDGEFLTLIHHLTVNGVSKQMLVDISVSGIGTVDGR